MWMQKYKKISRFLTFKRFLYQTEEYFYYYFEKTNRNYTNILFFFPTKQKQVSILFLSLPSNLIEVILNKFMSYLITPEGYKPLLDLKQTELGIKQIKEFFQLNLSSELRLRRVTAPLFVLKGMGINDDLNGVERAVTFPIKDLGDAKAEVVHSLAKWKRLTLAEYHIEPGYGIYTDMNAIRADEELGNLHSLYVDQWDWERVITAEDRNVEFLKEIVTRIYAAMVRTEYMVYEMYPQIKPWIDSLQTVGALRDTFIINPDGVQLHAIYAAAPEPTHKTAVIVHGYTDDCIRMLMIGYLYNKDLKYNILLPDLQNQGLSGGPAIQMGWKDRLDVLRWMDIANDIYGGNTQMVVHGISMGAATTMMVSGEPQQPFVKCFVEDCGYTSVWDEFSHELKSSFGLPPFPLMYTTSWLCEKKYGWDFKEASSLKQVAKCELPMLFIHGDKDTYVPTWMVYPLYEAKPEPKELWIVPGAAHAVSYQENKQEYTDKVREFVGRYIH